MDSSKYKYVAIGLVFRKYISDTFNTVYDKPKAGEYADEEDAKEISSRAHFLSAKRGTLGVSSRQCQTADYWQTELWMFMSERANIKNKCRG
jgi:hypothetical protein